MNSLTYSPLSCTLLFDLWPLCILLLVLPSSIGQQLSCRGKKTRQPSKQKIYIFLKTTTKTETQNSLTMIQNKTTEHLKGIKGFNR